jgi:hypothetical protein
VRLVIVKFCQKKNLSVRKRISPGEKGKKMQVLKKECLKIFFSVQVEEKRKVQDFGCPKKNQSGF